MKIPAGWEYSEFDYRRWFETGLLDVSCQRIRLEGGDIIHATEQGPQGARFLAVLLGWYAEHGRIPTAYDIYRLPELPEVER